MALPINQVLLGNAIALNRIANAAPLDLAVLQQNLARLGRELTEAQILELLSKAA